jgi:hypothetical protein
LLADSCETNDHNLLAQRQEFTSSKFEHGPGYSQKREKGTFSVQLNGRMERLDDVETVP